MNSADCHVVYFNGTRMPLQTDTYVNFFQGACAESHIAALFQFAGFEVTKVTPDAGIDLIVTNIARSRFRNEPPKSINVQVKSTVMNDNKAKFWIADDELAFLCDGEHRYTVFAIFRDLQHHLDFDNFDVYADQIDRLIELDAERFTAEVRSRENSSKWAKPNILDFTKYSLNLFWLNSKQMKRSRADGLWVDVPAKSMSYLPISTHDGILSAGHAVLMPALEEVRYMMTPSLSQAHFEEGKFCYDHI